MFLGVDLPKIEVITSREIPGTPNSGTPPSHKRDPYHSHTSPWKYGSSMGMGVTLLSLEFPLITLGQFPSHFSFRGFQFDVLKSPTNGATRNPHSFSARVGRLALSNDGRSKNVPCIDEANEGVE